MEVLQDPGSGGQGVEAGPGPSAFGLGQRRERLRQALGTKPGKVTVELEEVDGAVNTRRIRRCVREGIGYVGRAPGMTSQLEGEAEGMLRFQGFDGGLHFRRGRRRTDKVATVVIPGAEAPFTELVADNRRGQFRPVRIQPGQGAFGVGLAEHPRGIGGRFRLSPGPPAEGPFRFVEVVGRFFGRCPFRGVGFELEERGNLGGQEIDGLGQIGAAGSD